MLVISFRLFASASEVSQRYRWLRNMLNILIYLICIYYGVSGYQASLGPMNSNIADFRVIALYRAHSVRCAMACYHFIDRHVYD